MDILKEFYHQIYISFCCFYLKIVQGLNGNISIDRKFWFTHTLFLRRLPVSILRQGKKKTKKIQADCMLDIFKTSIEIVCMIKTSGTLKLTKTKDV
jgi:hypothetical protein